MEVNLEAVVKEAAKKIVRMASISPAVDVVDALKNSINVEVHEPSKVQLKAILDNINLASTEGAAVCQDTGVPTFFVRLGDGFPIRSRLYEILTEAVREATREIPLRSNSVDPLTDRNSGDNTGLGIPVIDVELFNGDYLEMIYTPKGGGTELPSRAFVVPPGDAWERLPKLVLDAVVDAGPMPCPPVIVGVGIGPSVDVAAKLAKKAAVLRPVGSRNQNPEVAKLEEALLRAINKLGIGPHGTGGVVTALDVHIEYSYRHPATFAIGIVFSCWATRRARAVVWPDGRYEVKPA